MQDVKVCNPAPVRNERCHASMHHAACMHVRGLSFRHYSSLSQVRHPHGQQHGAPELLLDVPAWRSHACSHTATQCERAQSHTCTHTHTHMRHTTRYICSCLTAQACLSEVLNPHTHDIQRGMIAAGPGPAPGPPHTYLMPATSSSDPDTTRRHCCMTEQTASDISASDCCCCC